MRWRRFPGFASVFQFGQSSKCFNRARATANLNQSADNITHHVTQKRGGFDGKNQQLAALFE